MARPSQTPPKPRQQPSGTSAEMMLISGPEPPPPLYGATFELIIGPSKPIVGVVRIKGTGRPAAGITVRGIEPTTGTWIYARADQDGRFRILGLPKAGVYQLRTEARSGVEPYLNAPPLTLGDTEGLKPIEAAFEVPRGVIITGRLIDQATGRPVRAAHVKYVKLPTNPNDGYTGTGHGGAVDPTFKMTVPPGEGLIYANVRGEETPYTRARLRKEDKGKGIGGPGDGEAIDHHAQQLPRLQVYRRPRRRPGFHGGSRTDPRPDAQGPGGRSRRQAGRRRAMLWTRSARPAPSSRRSRTRPSRSTAWSRATLARSSSRTRGAGWSARSPSRTRTSRARRTLEVRLGPPCSVRGRLVDEDGLPLAGATLSVMSYYGPGHYDSLPDRPRRCGPTTRPSPPTPTGGSRSRASSRASGASSASTSRPDRIPVSTPARSSGTSCPNVSARSATSAR